MTSLSSELEPAIWSRDTGQQITCFDRCQLIITCPMSNIKEVHGKPRLNAPYQQRRCTGKYNKPNDSELSFNEHVERLCKKLAKRIDVLRSIRHYLPFNERVLFYNATIKPLFLYGRAVWSMTSKTNIRRVFRLQKRAARTLLDVKTKEERTGSLFKKLNWMPFYDEIKLCLNYL